MRIVTGSSPLQSDTAENMEEELEYRRQRAQALAKMVSEVEEEKEELEKRKAKLEADTEQVRLHFGLRKLRTTVCTYTHVCPHTNPQDCHV